MYGTLRHTASAQYVLQYRHSSALAVSLIRSICTSQLSHGFYSAWDSTALVLYVLPRAEPEEVHTALARYVEEVHTARGRYYPMHSKNYETTITCTMTVKLDQSDYSKRG